MGYLRGGQRVQLKNSDKIRSRSCRDGYRGVEPRGYVCAGKHTTFDGRDSRLLAWRTVQPRAGAFPFEYAISNNTPMYRWVPTPERWARAERAFGAAGKFPKYLWHEKHERLAEERTIPVNGALPEVWLKSRGRLVDRRAHLGSMFGFTRSFAHQDRTWLLSADGTAVPADRVRPYRQSRFEGVELQGRSLRPGGWAQKKTVAWLRDGDGGFRQTPTHWPKRAWVPYFDEPGHADLRGQNSRGLPGPGYRKTTRVHTDGAALWVRANQLREVIVPRRTPVGTGPVERWVQVSIGRGVLVAMAGERAVFATLISPGMGGLPRRAVDPVKASTTPLGSFRIVHKYRFKTMTPQGAKPERDRTFFIADVPFAQFFEGPFALHTAYWHDDFGELMSGGCVNLSPLDGERLFRFTEPRLPVGWHSVSAGGSNGLGTRVVIVR
ncbi:MAG: L,D-transpeptidase [Polyangiaceae bacterium]|nr:L,D-transpeptidase [Polyangiaceae bacterium]